MAEEDALPLPPHAAPNDRLLGKDEIAIAVPLARVDLPEAEVLPNMRYWQPTSEELRNLIVADARAGEATIKCSKCPCMFRTQEDLSVHMLTLHNTGAGPALTHRIPGDADELPEYAPDAGRRQHGDPQLSEGRADETSQETRLVAVVGAPSSGGALVEFQGEAQRRLGDKGHGGHTMLLQARDARQGAAWTNDASRVLACHEHGHRTARPCRRCAPNATRSSRRSSC